MVSVVEIIPILVEVTLLKLLLAAVSHVLELAVFILLSCVYLVGVGSEVYQYHMSIVK